MFFKGFFAKLPKVMIVLKLLTMIRMELFKNCFDDSINWLFALNFIPFSSPLCLTYIYLVTLELEKSLSLLIEL